MVVLLFPAALTRSLTWLRASYDLRAVCGNVVKTYLQGEIQVKPSVTNVVVDLSDDEPPAETVNVDVSGQAIIVLPSAGSTTDSAVIDGLLAKIQQLEEPLRMPMKALKSQHCLNNWPLLKRQLSLLVH